MYIIYRLNDSKIEVAFIKAPPGNSMDTSKDEVPTDASNIGLPNTEKALTEMFGETADEAITCVKPLEMTNIIDNNSRIPMTFINLIGILMLSNIEKMQI